MVCCGVVGVAILLPIVLFVIPWWPADASTQASNDHTLYDVLLIVTVPIFVGVITVVGFSVWKFRMKPGEEEKDGPPIHGNTRLEVVWTAIPAVLILSMCGYSYSVLTSNEASHPGAMVVNVTARQFAFEFSYPRAGGNQIVTSQLYLPNNEPVVFKLRSVDVIHSFFVPQFSEKLDAVPGITTTLRVTPTRLGTYAAECTELCGAGHSLMRATVRVVTPSAFRTWLAAQKPNAPPPIGVPPPNAAQPGIPTGAGSSSAPASSSSSATSAATGKTIFTGVGTCGSCHTLAAAGTTGTVGPNLTQRLASDCATPASMKIRGKTLTDCIHTAITNPYAYIPTGFHSGIMPPDFTQRLGTNDVEALVNYLASVTK
ncbi:MAG: cytochrome c oxidase subunit II [Solirubrobacteraceae bacterium]